MGSDPSPHRHDEEQWGILLSGSGTRIQSGEEVAVSEGDFWLTREGRSMVWAGPNGARLIDVFAPPRDAYRSPGSGFSDS